VSDCVHCDGLSRSRLLHKAFAEAGRGLPSIERGMPLPAGTGLTRRRFVMGGLGGAAPHERGPRELVAVVTGARHQEV